MQPGSAFKFHRGDESSVMLFIPRIYGNLHTFPTKKGILELPCSPDMMLLTTFHACDTVTAVRLGRVSI